MWVLLISLLRRLLFLFRHIRTHVAIRSSGVQRKGWSIMRPCINLRVILGRLSRSTYKNKDAFVYPRGSSPRHCHRGFRVRFAGTTRHRPLFFLCPCVALSPTHGNACMASNPVWQHLFANKKKKTANPLSPRFCGRKTFWRMCSLFFSLGSNLYTLCFCTVHTYTSIYSIDFLYSLDWYRNTVATYYTCLRIV